MAARRTDMHRLQEVIRLHRLGQSCRRIARQLGMGRDTIRHHLRILAQAGLLEGAPEALPDLTVLAGLMRERLPQPEADPQVSSLARWSEEITHLLEKGAGPTAIHDHLRLHATGYDASLSAVKRFCLRRQRARGPQATDVAIPVETAPGQVAQVDFGYAGLRYDPERGVLRKSWVFVMTLGYSRRAFCALVFDQTLATWIALHVRAFEHFGGVPAVIVPDNLKAAVVRAAFAVDDDPVIQRSYRELARHYGFRVEPAPPRAPQKKGKVEAGVRYVKGNFLATWESVDLPADQAALLRWLAEVADQRRHGTTGRSPRELFEEQEQAALLPLPAARYEIVVWKKARLHTDAHVQIDGAFYSAPWPHLHQELWVRCSGKTVAIYRQDEHLWTHARVPRGQRSTLEAHLPEHRRDLRHRSREHWVERARRLGADVEQLVAAIFDADDVLTQLRRVQAIVTHLEGFPPARAQAAERRALHFGCTDYRGLKAILSQGLDLQPWTEPTPRAWATGARFSRRPTGSLLAHKE